MEDLNNTLEHTDTRGCKSSNLPFAWLNDANLARKKIIFF